uniref:Uncharacterized protein n=1 Tax=Panstrongylus lignarius TaxID=156445 RepID=A0A224XVJ9_9HEMI
MRFCLLRSFLERLIIRLLFAISFFSFSSSSFILSRLISCILRLDNTLITSGLTACCFFFTKSFILLTISKVISPLLSSIKVFLNAVYTS